MKNLIISGIILVGLISASCNRKMTDGTEAEFLYGQWKVQSIENVDNNSGSSNNHLKSASDSTMGIPVLDIFSKLTQEINSNNNRQMPQNITIQISKDKISAYNSGEVIDERPFVVTKKINDNSYQVICNGEEGKIVVESNGTNIRLEFAHKVFHLTK